MRYRAKTGLVAIRVIWSMKKDGEVLQNQFTACSVALNSTLLLVMRKENLAKWESVSKRLYDLWVSGCDAQGQNNDSFTTVMEKCNEISSIVRGLSYDSHDWNGRLQAVQDSIAKDSEIQRAWCEELGELKELFDRFDSATRELIYTRILDEISFNNMNARSEDIKTTKTAPETFEWLLDATAKPSEDRRYALGKDFQKWLAEGGAVFYIMGKPGSGKSTLMNIVANHPKTREQLDQWQPSRPDLIVTSVFFWNMGSTHQKSKEGLYRTLLYTILSNATDLIPRLFPERLKSQQRFIEHLAQRSVQTLPFSVVEEKLECLVSDPPTNLKFCVFIDGVDEFSDPNMENHELAMLIQRWSENPWIKICVSGREEEPWVTCFSKFPRLRLHEATQGDIQLMIEKSILKHPHFLELDADGRERFIQKFVERAEGVFLWVKHIKKEVVEALDYRKGLDNLYEVLYDAPIDLGLFYKRMFDRIQTREAWVILRLMSTAIDYWEEGPGDPLWAHHYSFVREILQTSSFAKNHETSSQFELLDESKQVDEMVQRLGGYGFLHQVPLMFRGVVESAKGIGPGSSMSELTKDEKLAHRLTMTVLKFSHRTAREYLTQYLEGQLGSVAPEQQRIIRTIISERRLVLQLMRRHIQSFWIRNDIQRIHFSFLAVFQWLCETPDRSVLLQDLLDLERLLIMRQSVRSSDSTRAFMGPDCYGYRFGRGWTSQDLDHICFGSTDGKPRGILSAITICLTFGYVEVVDWLHDNWNQWITGIVDGTREAALIQLLFYHLKGRVTNRQIFPEIICILLRKRTRSVPAEGRRLNRSLINPSAILYYRYIQSGGKGKRKGAGSRYQEGNRDKNPNS
ncbi:hypothetical protein QBC37DRAFT_60448 [Rhypophila decipiens]|uniref:Nephrocystin 3-like N-terminal domain-containing protein n=1 Tax=Rhypophila decipiens TaxID=261697 RepID=A0AAN7B3K4_9PEZI|nr:hypothetical protein QBC37DRAFT_60448 [Rhypophila decipiens]